MPKPGCSFGAWAISITTAIGTVFSERKFDSIIFSSYNSFKGKAGFITGENICIDGGQTKLMIYHGDHGWTLTT